MHSGLDHLPPVKRHELTRVVEILHEEFEDALKGAKSEQKKRGRILKIILFGSYARGNFVDEPHMKKGYRSDFDILIIVNNRKFADFTTYWNKAADRISRDHQIATPVSLIIHSLREVNTELLRGRYFFVDIRKDGVPIYELDDQPLALPGHMSHEEALKVANEFLSTRLPHAKAFLDGAGFYRGRGEISEAAFLLHQAIEQAYSTLLLVLTNYSPPSHNIKFLRGLAEASANELTGIWIQDQHRFVSWFNTLNAAYVKARYSQHFDLSAEALDWLIGRGLILLMRVREICDTHVRELGR